MKRSEVLKKLEKFLIEADLEAHRLGSSEDILAEDVLNFIEDLGMLPPEHLFTSGEREGHYLNEWERE